MHRLSYRPEKENAAASALFFTLNHIYGQVLEPEQFRQLLVFLAKPNDSTSLFIDPQLIDKREARKRLKSDSFISVALPGFPVFYDQFNSNKQRRDVRNRLIQSIGKEKGIAFSQSVASALPYWLIAEEIKTGRRFGDGSILKILDVCGAPGNKSFNMMHLEGYDEIELVINDIKPERLE